MRSIDDELAELVFEGLDATRARQLSRDISGREVFPPKHEQGVVELELPRLLISPTSALHNAHLRVLRYNDDFYDVEVNFVPSAAECTSSAALLESLHEFAIRLSAVHRVSSYYAGLDPASDEDTRFFTGTKRGPYL